MALWEQIEKHTDTDPSSEKTSVSSQTGNPKKPRETKSYSLWWMIPCPPPSLCSLFFHFSPPVLLCIGTYWKSHVVGLWFYYKRHRYKRSPGEIGDEKVCHEKRVSFASLLSSKTSGFCTESFFLDSASLSRLQNHKRFIGPWSQKGKLRL